jgi:hypothetical protein
MLVFVAEHGYEDALTAQNTKPIEDRKTCVFLGGLCD